MVAALSFHHGRKTAVLFWEQAAILKEHREVHNIYCPFVGAYLTYRFAQGMAVPWFAANAPPMAAVRDGTRMVIGLTIWLAAVLLSIAAGTLVQGVKFLLRKPAETA